jgi:cytochrome P450
MQLSINATDDEGRHATLEELTDQCLTQLFAGHETTGVSMARMLCNLPKFPAVLDKLRQEQARLRQKHGDAITGAMLDEMRYADCVLKEQLRMYPVVPAVWRRTLTDIEVGGKRIPKGWRVQLMLQSSIASIKEFEETKGQFNPDRWLDSTGTQPRKDPKGYLPFGDGARVCIGMKLATSEMKALLAVLVRDYDWEMADPDEEFFNFKKAAEERLPLNLRKRRDAQ